MPIVAQVMVTVDFQDTGVIEILREEFNRCGCLNLVTESERLNLPIEDVARAAHNIDGVSCIGDNCCVVGSFVDVMRKLRAG